MKYPKLFLSILALTSLLLNSTVASANEALQSAMFDNGVKLIVEEDHSAPVAMVQVWLKVGGRDEVPGKTGLAHVFEHMMFKGSKKLAPGEFSKRIAYMGGNDNAFTSTDYTAYFETVPSAQVDHVLSMEAERFGHLKLDAEAFGREIRVIMEERRMRTEDDPNSRMYEELASAALRLHPYRNPVIGWMQDLEKLTITDVRAFYRAHYVPGNATVVVVGDVDFKDVKKTVGKTFGRLKAKPVPPRFNPTEPEPLGQKRVDVQLPAKAPMWSVVIPVPVWQPGKNDRQVAALAVATEILAGGRSALLNRELVDQQRKAFSSGAGYDPFGMGLDLWYAYGALGPKQSTTEFEQAFWALLHTFKTKKLDKAQVDAAKRRLIADEVFAQDSLYLRAKQIGSMETTGIGADKRDTWLDMVRKVSAKDIQEAVQLWLKPERATIGTLHPEAKS